jgi:hypothetical protein
MVPAEFVPLSVAERGHRSLFDQSPPLKAYFAIVSPRALGGVRTMISKLVKGLQREGFHVSVVPLVQANLLAKLYSDMADLKKLRGFDAVIYMGSIPWPSHILISDDTLVALFVHGFVRQELINVMKLRRFKAGPLLSLSLWSISKSIGRIDLFICHSHTSCEANGIRERFVLLPQFVFPEEVELYSELKKSFEEDSGTSCERFKVVTYASFATSPRLLTQPYVLTLMKEVSKRVKKEIELVMIDPKTREREERWENLLVRYVKYLRREDFLRLLAQSDLYIERCIDEELGLASIEAALLGTPIAKLTHPKFVNRQDYREEVIWSSSFKGLAEAIADYLNNIYHQKPLYSKKLRDFLISRRSWDHVKKPLIDSIRNGLK